MKSLTFQSGPQTGVCTKHLSRLSGSAEWTVPFQPVTSRRNLPPSVLETRWFPPTVLLKSGAQPGKGCLVISRLGRGAEPSKHLFGIAMGVGAKTGVQSRARDQGEGPKCTDGVKAPGQKDAPKTRLNPVGSQLGVRLTGLAPSSC